MKIVWSPAHLGHSGHVELGAGVIEPGFECPERLDFVLEAWRAAGLGPELAPAFHDLGVAGRVHAPDYVAFLGEAWNLWTAAGYAGPALPMVWPTHNLRADLRPEAIRALLGYYSFDGGASFVAGTWDAVAASYATALTGADLVSGGERVAFAACRPPGHHAGRKTAGGYCYLNNAACAAERLRDRGAARVAVLDVDFHHGNGTQEIFWERSDVFFASLHGDPRTEYPFFLGAADEIGAGAGEGFNLNLPMRAGSGFEVWGAALDAACRRIAEVGVDALVVSLGLDTFEGDPISHFRLRREDYPKIGARLSALGLPTLFVLEGGYAVADLGVNALGVLTGFEGA
ncbi:MAG: histone deacetylase family protein [Hyphomicrobiales bacterium]|nr:histone deacetylase family protein [Hyphomicrobiales bacterium]